MEILSKSLEETKNAAQGLVDLVLEQNRAGATVVSMVGNLGAGKTTFVQAVAEIFGVKDNITSPTFVIMKSYKLENDKFDFLIHIDAYRLKGGEDLTKLGFNELVSNPRNLILIEWADLVSSVVPMDSIKLYFEFVDDQTRKITSDF